jgi:hypothetical protein
MSARRRAERKWNKARSGHATVLRELERSMRAHPAGGARRFTRATTVVVMPGDGSPDAA